MLVYYTARFCILCTRMRNMQQNKTVRECLYGFTVSALFIWWTPLCLQIVLQTLFTSSRFTKDSCIIFVSLFFYIFPSLTQGGEKDSEAYQKLEGRLKLKVIRRFWSLSVISFWIFLSPWVSNVINRMTEAFDSTRKKK